MTSKLTKMASGYSYKGAYIRKGGKRSAFAWYAKVIGQTVIGFDSLEEAKDFVDSKVVA